MTNTDPNLNPQRACVLALGNFDGVHRGHMAVIHAAQAQARRLGLLLHVLTLEPHPRTLFRPNDPPFRLTPAPVKDRLLRALGVNDVVTLPFTRATAERSAPDFMAMLTQDYGARHIVAGFDFVFGHQRSGSMQTLREGMAGFNVEVTEVAPSRDSTGEIMSSSRTRTALQAGDLETAQHILGRPWSITGKVIQGAHMAREIGFPTANVELGDYLRPKFGVYAIRARREGTEAVFSGVANLGNRPTLDGLHELLEFHLFDFCETIYDEMWEIELLHFLRPEQKFPDLTALKAQIGKDVESAKSFF